MSILIAKAGVYDTFRDAGRYGYQHLGIYTSGAMDMLAMQVANALTCNPPATAVLEMHFPASQIRFKQDALMALTGADFQAFIEHTPIPINHPVLVAKESLLQFKQPLRGARAYFSVRGGFVLEQWLGSYTTNLLCVKGGFNGRKLSAGDVIPFTQTLKTLQLPPGAPALVLPIAASLPQPTTLPVVRFLPGQHYDQLTAESKTHLQEQNFTITSESNRMGYRLQSTSLTLTQTAELVSSGATMGTLQLLPNGQLVLLMADHQTTGGYPVIGHVITHDLPAVAQCLAGQQLQFKMTSPQQAHELLLHRQRHLLQLQNACTFRLSQYV